jgi:hypothetical protein
MIPTRTRDVAEQLQEQEFNLLYLIGTKKIARPARDSNGVYCWSPENVTEARAVIEAKRKRKAEMAAV